MSNDLHTLSGAYALNALSPDEAREFRKHYDLCRACQQEVRELRDAAARMGASEAMQPPPQLKARVMSAADKQPQLPPRVPQATREEARPPTEASEGRKWFPRLLVAAAVVLIAAGGVSIGVNQLNQEPESNLAAGVTRVFEADDARTKTVRTSNGGEIAVATSPSRGEMAVDTDGLPELSGNQVYQLWSIAGDTIESAAVLEDPDRGASMAMPSEGVEVAITIEPNGGSEQPTTDPIIALVPSEV